MARVCSEEAMDTAARLGVRSPLEPVLSAVLGSNDVTALDMATASATFAIRWGRVPPIIVTRITRSNGTVLFQHQHRQEKVLEPDVGDTLTSILRQVIERGTGRSAAIGRPAAGKTGTTDDWRDAWFVGFTPALATSVWVGFPEVGPDGRQVRMQPPATPIRATAAPSPAATGTRFLARPRAAQPSTHFPPPPPTPPRTPPPPPPHPPPRRLGRRLCRRVHPGTGHIRVGGLPRGGARRQAGAHAAARHPDPRHRRLVPRGHLAAVHEQGAGRTALDRLPPAAHHHDDDSAAVLHPDHPRPKALRSRPRRDRPGPRERHDRTERRRLRRAGGARDGGTAARHRRRAVSPAGPQGSTWLHRGHRGRRRLSCDGGRQWRG